MKHNLITIAIFSFTLAACTQTSIQPLTQNSFKVATDAAPACGREGARNVAFQSAAIEVIRRGGDKFIVVADRSGSQLSGVGYDQFTGFTAYSTNQQDMVIQMLSQGDPQFQNGLSARESLGADWQAIVAEGTPNTCT